MAFCLEETSWDTGFWNCIGPEQMCSNANIRLISLKATVLSLLFFLFMVSERKSNFSNIGTPDLQWIRLRLREASFDVANVPLDLFVDRSPRLVRLGDWR